MKERQIQMEEVMVSEVCRTYSYRVVDFPRDTRRFTVEVPSELFTANFLKFQDGPLITREKLIGELERELPQSPAELQLRLTEKDVIAYMTRHSPRKSSWNRYKQVEI